jgi:N-acyl-D-amino-acid deacylase
VIEADILFRNARIIDGSGGPSLAGDVAVAQDRIVAVGAGLEARAAETVDATGLVLAPGFIDAHTHDDRIVLTDPGLPAKVSQGVTSVVVGNCGVSIAPVVTQGRPPAPIDLVCREAGDFFPSFAAYFERLERTPPAVNVIAQCGHSSLRLAAMDDLSRPATGAEIETMRQALAQALADGAAGFSTGLEYPVARGAPTEEVIALAEVAGRYRGFHSTHMRNESEGVMDSLAESFRIGREAGVPVVISHHKCAGVACHGRSLETLPAIAEAARNQEVGLDVYPYTASSTMLDPERVKRASRTVITWSAPHPGHAGRDLDDIAEAMRLPLTEAIEALQPAGAVYFMMDEADVRRILAFETSMIGSDGLPHDRHPHPRLWGTFPRVLGHYVRDVGLFPLETAVHKMTGLTAATFRLRDRGAIRPGAYADLVLFDPATVADAATFEQPTEPARGIRRVYVNGAMVWSESGSTGARPGRALKRAA